MTEPISGFGNYFGTIGGVTKLRASDGALLGNYPVATGIGPICFDGANIWVTVATSNTVTKISPAPTPTPTPPPTPNTPIGSPVTVTLSGAVVTFSSVTGAGTTSISTSPAAPCGSLPSGFVVRGLTQDITTTATYSGTVSVGISYNDAGIPTEGDMRLFHCDGSSWHDVTTSVDPVNNIIYGQDSSLSWWLIGDPPEPGGGGGAGVPVFPSTYIGIGAALGAGVLGYMLRKRLVQH